MYHDHTPAAKEKDGLGDSRVEVGLLVGKQRWLNRYQMWGDWVFLDHVALHSTHKLIIFFSELDIFLVLVLEVQMCLFKGLLVLRGIFFPLGSNIYSG